MSQQQLKAFQEAVRGDGELRDQLRAAVDADAVVAIATTAGFMLSADDLMQAQRELSDEQLSDVTGGLQRCGSCWAFLLANDAP